jgi:hypothetical protein
LKELTVGGSGDVVGKAVKASALGRGYRRLEGSVRFPDLQAPHRWSLSIGGSGDFETSGRAQEVQLRGRWAAGSVQR